MWKGGGLGVLCFYESHEEKGRGFWIMCFYESRTEQGRGLPSYICVHVCVSHYILFSFRMK